MKLSIVVPSRPKLSLITMLESLKPQLFGAELIIEIRGKNPAQARNIGWHRANGDLIVFIDDDIILAPDFLENGVNAMIENDWDFAQSKVIGSQENSKDKFIGTALWFKRTALEELDGFDESYPFNNEDLDLFLRAKKYHKFLKYGFIENSVAFHPLKGTYEKLAEGNEILKRRHPNEYKNLKKELR
jgi:GT2 family glycosyltransferase